MHIIIFQLLLNINDLYAFSVFEFTSEAQRSAVKYFLSKQTSQIGKGHKKALSLIKAYFAFETKD